jgi:hypothetical protein
MARTIFVFFSLPLYAAPLTRFWSIYTKTSQWFSGVWTGGMLTWAQICNRKSLWGTSTVGELLVSLFSTLPALILATLLRNLQPLSSQLPTPWGQSNIWNMNGRPTFLI